MKEELQLELVPQLEPKRNEAFDHFRSRVNTNRY